MMGRLTDIGLRECAAEIIGEMQYENTYRLAYIRGPEGIVVALAAQSAKT
jgi:hypothetical protein